MLEAHIHEQHYATHSEDITEEQEVGELLKNITEYSSQVIAHIAGQARINPSHKFIMAKDKGGLVYPSSDIIKICKMAEIVI
ncbi:hypothetical protein SFRURICE_006304 [Spodoptera frugiperda]|nr:hypothetical protein SFRURICE_006304 [Spodoptera frugiperda]